MKEYKRRCYQNYVTTRCQGRQGPHTIEEYELLARTYPKRFKDILPQDKTAQIIDIACGAGHFLYFLQQQGYTHSQGVDLSKEQVSLAQEAGVRNIEQADLFEYLPQHPKAFDVILANHVIEHLSKEEVLKFLDLIYASLKPDGCAVIGTPNASALFGNADAFKDFTHETAFTPESLTQVMQVCSFKNMKIYGEGPIAYDLRSGLRSFLWWLLKKFLKGYLTIVYGTGRGILKPTVILEPNLIAVAKKSPACLSVHSHQRQDQK